MLATTATKKDATKKVATKKDPMKKRSAKRILWSAPMFAERHFWTSFSFRGHLKSTLIFKISF